RLRQQPLVQRVGRQSGRDGVGPHQFRRDPRSDVGVHQAVDGVLGEPQAADAARRILQRFAHRVPAVEQDRAVAVALATIARPRLAAAAVAPVVTPVVLAVVVAAPVMVGALTATMVLLRAVAATMVMLRAVSATMVVLAVVVTTMVMLREGTATLMVGAL